MKHLKKVIVTLLAMMIMLTGLSTVSAEDNGLSDGGEITPFEPGPILNEPQNYSDDIVIDEDTDVESGQLLSSLQRRKMQKDIEELLSYQPISISTVRTLISSTDDFVASGGLDHTSDDITSILQSTHALSAKAMGIGLEQTKEELIEVIDTQSNATGYIFVIDRNSLAFKVENKQGVGIENALVTIFYTNAKGQQVTKAQYTTGGNLPGLCAFDGMADITYVTIDIQAGGYRAQTVLDKRISAGDILYFQLEDSPENDIYIRCGDLAGKDILLENTELFLVDSGSKPLDLRFIITTTGNRKQPENITLKDDTTGRTVTAFSSYSPVSQFGSTSRMFTASQDWMKKDGLLHDGDVLYLVADGSELDLPYLSVHNALMTPGTSKEDFPITGVNKEIPLTDVMGGTGVASLMVKYFRIPVTIGFFPDGGFIIVATFDIDSLSTSYSSLFEESWNPKTRSESESIFEPFKQEFWRKADRFKSGTGQMDDSKSVSLARDKYWSLKVSFSLFCTGKYNKNTTNFDGSFGGIFDIKLSGGVTQYFLVSTPIVIPFYLGFDISGKLKSSLTANFVWNKLSEGIESAFSAADHALVERHELIAGLELYAGVGLKGVCSLEVAGGANMDFAAVIGTVEDDNPDATRFLIDSFATLRVSASIAFFNINIFNKAFGPWRLYDSHPDGAVGSGTPVAAPESEFIDTDFAATNEKATLLLAAASDDGMNHYQMASTGLSESLVNGYQTISPLSVDTYGDNQVQIASTGKTTALFRIVTLDGKARIIYQKQDPATGKFMDDFYELPAFKGYDVTEFDVAASSNEKNYFYIGAVVADGSVSDIDARSKTTWVQGVIVDLDNDRIITSKVKSPLPDGGKYYYFNPRVAGRDSNIAVAYQKAYSYRGVNEADACLFGYNESGEIIMGKGQIFTSGDIVDGEPSFFVTNRSHTTTDTLVIDAYRANGYFDENNPRMRFRVNVQNYKLSENENYITNWGYANGTNYAIIAGKLYYLEKYASSYDEYGYGMRMTEVKGSENLINRENIYEFVISDDKSTLCLVGATTSMDVNMETGEHKVSGSTVKVYTLISETSSDGTNVATLHGPLDIFVENIAIDTFAAVFNRDSCASKGLSIVYADIPEATLSANGKIAFSENLYHWQQNLKRGMEITAVEFSDPIYYTDQHVLPVKITYRNIGYAIEGPIAFTIKDEVGMDLHEMYQHPQTGTWYDLGNEVEHNFSKLYPGDSYQCELIIAASQYWDTGKVHEVNVEIVPKYRGDANLSFKSPIINGKLKLQAEQIVTGTDHYADLSVFNPASLTTGLNKIVCEIRYDDGTVGDRYFIDLSNFSADPDNDRYSIRYNLQPIWDRAEKESIIAVRFFLADENNHELTGESVFMYPQDINTRQAVEYTISSGADGQWTKGSKEGHVIKVVRSVNEETCFSHFQSVSIDGSLLTREKDYSAESGSTVITLKKDYLNNLAEGKHDVEITFDDGSVKTTITILKADSHDITPAPYTGDRNSITAWSVLLTASLLMFLQLRKTLIRIGQ